MTTATEPTTAPQIDTEAALWLAIGVNPADALPRLVAADWYEERVGTVECERCVRRTNGRMTCPDCVHWKGYVPKSCRCGGRRSIVCEECGGTRRVSNGYAETAAALRATKDCWPIPWKSLRLGGRVVYLFCKAAAWGEAGCEYVPTDLFGVMTGGHTHGATWLDYPTAEAAIRDLCRAYVKVNRGRG